MPSNSLKDQIGVDRPPIRAPVNDFTSMTFRTSGCANAQRWSAGAIRRPQDARTELEGRTPVPAPGNETGQNWQLQLIAIRLSSCVPDQFLGITAGICSRGEMVSPDDRISAPSNVR